MSQGPSNDAFPAELAARYRRVATIGAGAQGRVERAVDLRLGREVAIKLLGDAETGSARARFAREGRLLARVRAPQVVEVLEVGEVAGAPYLVMEYVEGGPLESAADATETLGRMVEVARGLEAIHAAGVVHRDLKPSNVLVTPAGRVVIVDFGLAKSEDVAKVTRTGAAIGSLAYMAPELLAGEAATPAADWWAWGAVLHELVMGDPPWTLPALALAGATGELPPLPAQPDDPRVRRALAAVFRMPPDARDGAAARREAAGRAGAPGSVAPRARSDLGAARGVGGGDLAVRASERPAGSDRDEGGVSGRGGVAAGGSPRRWAAGVAVAGLLAGAGVVALGRRVPVAAPPPLSPGLPPPTAALVEWGEVLGELRVEEVIGGVHAAVYGAPSPDVETYTRTQRYPSGEGHQLRMRARRMGGPPDYRPGARGDSEWTAALREEAANLPRVEGFRRDRDRIRAAWKDTGGRRFFDLVEGLDKLASIDRYFEAWGEAAPYGAAEVLRAGLPWRCRMDPGPWPERRDVPLPYARASVPPIRSGQRLGPGRHLLGSAATERTKTLPAIAQDPERLSVLQRTIYVLGQVSRLERVAVPSRLAYEFSLEPEPARRFREVRLTLSGANILPPDAYAIRINRLEFHVAPPTASLRRRGYKISERPEYHLEIPLPLAALYGGGNRLVVGLDSVPGLNPYQGADVHEVWLTLEARHPGPPGGATGAP